MGEVVNLNQFRKKREQEIKNRRSAENKVRSGRKKSEKDAARADTQRKEADLSGKRLDGLSPDEPRGA